MRLSRWMVLTVVYLFFLSTLAIGAEVRKITQEDIAWGDPTATITSAGGHVGHYLDNTIVSPGWVNVKSPEFGAVGDNVTNDTAAIQAAIDTGLPVFIPAGTYAVDTITVTGMYRLINGAGGAPTMYSGYQLYPGGIHSYMGQTTTLRARGTGPVLSVQLHQNQFSNINFDGNFTAPIVVQLNISTTKTVFYRCSFTRALTSTGRLVDIKDTPGTIQDDFNAFRYCYFIQDALGTDNTGTGAYILGSNTQKQMFERCYFTNLATGIYVRGGTVDVIDSQFEQCSAEGISLYGGGAPGRIVGNYTETTGMYLIRMTDSTGTGDEALIVENNWINAVAYNVFYNYYTIKSTGNTYKGTVTFNKTVLGDNSKPVLSTGDTFGAGATPSGTYESDVIYVGTTVNNAIKVRAAPDTSTAACKKGLTTYDNNYKYWCYSDNNWRRVAYDNTF